MDAVATPVAVIEQVRVVKPWWRSRTMQALVAGLLSSAAVLAVAVDQLTGLISANGQYIPPTWTSPVLTGLSIVGIVCKFIAMDRRVKAGDLTAGKTS